MTVHSFKGALAVGGLLVAGAVVFFVTIGATEAQETRHPPEHMQLHHQFYKHWKQPDQPKVSCCGLGDCFPVEVKHEDGNLYVKSFWDGAWVLIPPKKIDQVNTSPDGQNHACLSKPSPGVAFDGYMVGPSKGNYPYCFIYGAGT